MRIIKKTKIKIISILFFSVFMSSCGSHLISYKPSKKMNIEDAFNKFEELIMTQHKKWRPNYIEINDKYILLGYGMVSKSEGSAASIEGFTFGSSTTRTKDIGERLYYNSIDHIQLMSWKRKFIEWFVVSSIDRNNGISHLFYTRNLEDAKLFYESFNSILLAYKKF